MLQRFIRLACLGLCLAGCTAPKPFDDQMLAEAASQQQQALAERMATLSGPVTLAEALAFSLDNNLEFRLHAYNSALATGNRKLATMSMLPTLTARAGYRNRSNVQASVSESVDTGQVSLAASTSSDKEGNSRDLELGWNALDFGLAWFRAREFGEQALIAEEERRRVSYQLAMDLISAWDKAAAFKLVAEDLQQSRELLDQALTLSDAIYQQRLRDQVEIIEYRKALLLILRRINQLTQQMKQAEDELTRLMGLPAGTKLDLDIAESDVAMLSLAPEISLPALQWVALLHRPEMHQALYTERSARRDTLRRTVETFPSLLFSYGMHYDSNSFMVNNRWRDTGVSMSLNLIKLASLPTQRRLGKLNEQAASARVELQATAILSQVAIAEKIWRSARFDACLSNDLARLDKSRLVLLDARAQAAALDRLTVIRSRVDNLLFRIEAALARAEMRRAGMMLAMSLGIGAIPDSFESDDAEAKAEEIGRWLGSDMQARLDSLVAGADLEPDEDRVAPSQSQWEASCVLP